MKKDFFEWLFDVLKININSKSKIFKDYNRKIISENGFKNVNRYTRAGKIGKVIHCPVCGEPELVYHFSWASMTCPSCRETSNKNDWLIKCGT
tara:strand:+ start:236 stop:514 length:279 start_codon:yes stop_codon:yes gene_type:complete